MSNEIQSGDIFRLGPHRLIVGDARDQQTVAKLMGEEKVAEILTDPPYGIAVVESRFGFSSGESQHKVIANDHIQSEDEYLKFTKQWLDAIKPYLDKKNSIYVFNSDKMIFTLKDAMDQTGCHFAQLLIWVKTQAVIGRLDYLPQHELIAYGWFGRHKFRRSKDKSVLVYPKPSKSSLHPTMKPVGLLRKLILNSTAVSDIIYDPFAGSGSSIMAAEQTKRRCFAIECDLDYCLKIMERYKKMTGVSAEKISSHSDEKRN